MVEKKTKEKRKSIKDIQSRITELYTINLLNRSKKLYKDGDVVEAFVILYTLLEYELFSIWAYFLNAISDQRKSAIIDDVDKQRTYMRYVQLFFEVGLLNENGKRIFNEFHVARNRVVHELYHFKKGFDFNKKELNGKFKAGLKATTILKLDIYYKIVNQYVLPKFKDPKAPWEFSTPKQSDLVKIAKKWMNLNDFGNSSEKS